MRAATTSQIGLAEGLPGEARPARGGLIRRGRLLEKLKAAGDTPVIAVVAPAGYGKSTLLADWAEQDDRPSAWLTLDERHNDPVVLLTSIAAALHRIEPVPADVVARLATAPRADSRVMVPRLQEVLKSRAKNFILVLDDLHLADNPDCVNAVASLARSLAAGSQMAIASRTEHPLPLGRLRADRMVSELGAGDLAMDGDEAGQTLAACGLELRPDPLRRLLERTEGWPVGIYLAGLSLTRKTKVEEAIADFHGDDRLVVDYVRDELFAGLDRESLDFLTETSILDRLSGELCDGLLERQGSGELLRRLSRSNRLIVPLDRGDHVYRHHALLREMLLSELEQRGASVTSALHTRASTLFSEQGDVDRAVAHAIQSGDRELAAELIWTNSSAFVWTGRYATLRGWLANYTDQQISTSPGLCLARATCSLTEGDGAEVEHWTNVAVDRLAGSKLADHALVASAKIIRASGAARDGVTQMRADALASIEKLSATDPYCALCHLLDGVARHLTSDRAGAHRPLEDAARAAALTAPALETLSRAQLALLAVDEGDITEGERQAQLAVVKADHYGLRGDATQALVYAVSALVKARRGRSDEAIANAKTAVVLQTGLHEMSPWYEAETRITLGRALILLDDVVAARSHLAAASRYHRMTPDAVVLKEWLDVAWSDTEAAGTADGRWPLTPAELRLLHMLPTHFSFREIAERAFVSQNTVKTQAQSVYRKLGVSSRAEAVACARAAGLLSAGDQDSPEAGDASSMNDA